jgi:maltose-binding protein MalE
MHIGLARIPKIDETGLWPTPLVSPMGYSINKNLRGEDLRVAAELIKFLTRPDVELQYTRLSGSIPSMQSAYADTLVTGNPLIQNAIDQLMTGRPMPVVTEMRWIFDAMRPGYQSIFTGRMTPAQAAADMQRLAEKLIKENRE